MRIGWANKCKSWICCYVLCIRIFIFWHVLVSILLSNQLYCVFSILRFWHVLVSILLICQQITWFIHAWYTKLKLIRHVKWSAAGLRWFHIDCRIFCREECIDKPGFKRIWSDWWCKITTRGYMPWSCLLCWHTSIGCSWCCPLGIYNYNLYISLLTETHKAVSHLHNTQGVQSWCYIE